MLHTCPVGFVIPIRVRRSPVSEIFNIRFAETRVQTFIDHRLAIQTSIVVRADTVDHFRRFLETDISIIRDTRFAGLTSFRSNQDNAIGRLRTVDSGRSGIFQYGNTFDIVRVDRVHRTGFDTIHQDIRVSRVQRTDTTHADRTAILPGTATAGSNLNTRHSTLQSGRNVLYRTVFQHFTVYHSNSTGHIHLLLRTVTYDNDFFQLLRVFH